MSNKVKVYSLESVMKGYIKEIDNTLESLQAQVGGHIEIVGLDREGELDLFVHEEGKLIDLAVNRCWLDDEQKIIEVICGNAFVARHDEAGNTTDILESDIPYIEKTLRPILMYAYGAMMYLDEGDEKIVIKRVF